MAGSFSELSRNNMDKESLGNIYSALAAALLISRMISRYQIVCTDISENF